MNSRRLLWVGAFSRWRFRSIEPRALLPWWSRRTRPTPPDPPTPRPFALAHAMRANAPYPAPPRRQTFPCAVMGSLSGAGTVPRGRSPLAHTNSFPCNIAALTWGAGTASRAVASLTPWSRSVPSTAGIVRLSGALPVSWQTPCFLGARPHGASDRKPQRRGAAFEGASTAVTRNRGYA
jgi:hypothetical protein